MARKPKSFESAMEELEAITQALESGTLTLEQSIKHYKKGLELSGYCTEVLNQAEQELYVLGEEGFEKINEGMIDES